MGNPEGESELVLGDQAEKNCISLQISGPGCLPRTVCSLAPSVGALLLLCREAPRRQKRIEGCAQRPPVTASL